NRVHSSRALATLCHNQRTHVPLGAARANRVKVGFEAGESVDHVTLAPGGSTLSAVENGRCSWRFARPQRKREGDGRAARLVVDRPQAPTMRLDDRTADCEPHAHPVPLGREERLEGALNILETGSGVTNLDTDRVGAVAA